GRDVTTRRPGLDYRSSNPKVREVESLGIEAFLKTAGVSIHSSGRAELSPGVDEWATPVSIKVTSTEVTAISRLGRQWAVTVPDIASIVHTPRESCTVIYSVPSRAVALLVPTVAADRFRAALDIVTEGADLFALEPPQPAAGPAAPPVEVDLTTHAE